MLVRDIVSSLRNCLRQKEDEPPDAATHQMQNRAPRGERGGISAEAQLAKVREAHWKALATTMDLEEKIEQLS